MTWCAFLNNCNCFDHADWFILLQSQHDSNRQHRIRCMTKSQSILPYNENWKASTLPIIDVYNILRQSIKWSMGSRETWCQNYCFQRSVMVVERLWWWKRRFAGHNCRCASRAGRKNHVEETSLPVHLVQYSAIGLKFFFWIAGEQNILEQFAPKCFAPAEWKRTGVVFSFLIR